MKELLKQLIEVIYPNYCIACGKIMESQEDFLCTKCRHSLVVTNFHLNKNNHFYTQFSPQIPIELATSLLFFQKEGATQSIIHSLKYHREEKIGEWLGKWLGEALSQIKAYQSIDAVVPIPMHPDKEKIRGYNQVTLFGKEIAKSLQANFIADALAKTHNIASQTKKNKLLRSESTKNLYALNNSIGLEGKHILLVDDVTTTGATLLSCGAELLKIKNVQLSLATMAYVANE